MKSALMIGFPLLVLTYLAARQHVQWELQTLVDDAAKWAAESDLSDG